MVNSEASMNRFMLKTPYTITALVFLKNLIDFNIHFLISPNGRFLLLQLVIINGS